MDLERLAKLLNVPKLGTCRRNESWFERNDMLCVRLRGQEQSGGRSVAAGVGIIHLRGIAKSVKVDIATLQEYMGEIEAFLAEKKGEGDD